MNVFSDLKLNSKTSVYLQIIQHVKRKILNKSIIAYTPLPSRRELQSCIVHQSEHGAEVVIS